MPPDPGLARLLDGLQPAELALRDWVRTRLNASIVRDIAALDHGMRVEEYQDGIEDLLVARRLPEKLPWNPGEVLELSSFTNPDAAARREHVARLFSCLMLVRGGDTVYPAGALAGLVDSALALGPDATAPALRFVAWCRRHEPGGWRDEPEARPLLTLGLLLLYTAAPGHDPAVEAGLREACAGEVRAATPAGQEPSASFKAAAGGERRRTWRALFARYLTGQEPAGASVATLRAWLKLDDPPLS
ncbi:hypothetical protein AB0K00_18570 [Dactylosporangium sp. NPDC049525]|uniref:hypothetical protein n=1 Tax=Dactylosporangium sp. NPDC049525 TaxID=3154730 RepID=UPI00342693A1